MARRLLGTTKVCLLATMCLVASSIDARGQSYGMSISAYDYYWGDTNTAWAGIDYYDDSWGCDHGDYGTVLAFSGPTGSAYFSDWGPSGAVSLPAGDGEFLMQSGLSLYCSCAGPIYPAVYIVNQPVMKLTVTYFTGLTQIGRLCTYNSLACSSGTPTCTNASTVYFDLDSDGICDPYAAGGFLAIRVPPSPYACFPGPIIGMDGPGVCN